MKFNHPSGHKDTQDDYFSGNESEQESNDEEKNEDNQDEAEEDKKDKKPAKIRTTVRKPQPKLDSTRLCGNRGLKCLLENFENFKTKGDGHEFRDLDIMISKYEYWAHRLFPKMKFTDVVERLEKLGEKREVKNLLHRLRLGDTEPDFMATNAQDPALEDEQMTARVMDMMKNISERDFESDDENPPFRSNDQQEDGRPTQEEEDEIFNRLLNA